MSSHIIVVGSLNLDFVARAERLPAPGETVTSREFATFHGGKGANQAYAAARLGGRVAMIGQVGVDTHADALRENLTKVNVDTAAVTSDEKTSSGMAFITIDAAGQNSIVIVPGANGTLTPERLERSRETIAAARVVLLQFETPMKTVVCAARMAKEAGALVILDPAPAREVPNELLRLADYITPNETELAALTGDPVVVNGNVKTAARMARVLRSRGARNVIVKMGAAGALCVSENESEQFWEAVPVEAVDTTAAGDCFNAAFAVGLAEGMTRAEAGRLAVAAASLSVTRRGAQAAMPSRDEVERFINDRKSLVEEEGKRR